ncbi:MAG TPA: ABC transporter ATP-binding protein [Candidatus Intestinimonas stercoravium]|uniref:ABC transporter ATP-binding protein n=1 Tax=uncultured Intestinimonas sp. TaxID=1689265 RepID=UPI001F8586DA|nr:ABC transporter ATP-binding protein [uncultured Intestinimonas sp.]HJA64028.1 ABC transporter ATP-binding protein [Candidatus Intestinimonas stercoravium]
MSQQPILEIKDLHVNYVTEDATVQAVNGIDLTIHSGESLGLVGETGAGKTTTCLSIMQLVPDPPGLITAGKILFKGEDMIYNTDKRNEEIRGNGISMIFQDPMTALNPVMTVGEQLSEVVRAHQKVSKAEAKRKVIEALEVVGVKGDRYDDYPHQFSGGMKQRVVITMALLCRPELLIADEPTTALDVTIQAQVLELIKKLQREMGTSLLLITHDLGVVAETCDRVAIMYAGEIVEHGTVEEVFRDTRHPYTQGLFDSIPKMTGPCHRLTPIEGLPPDPADLPRGCCFHPRCRYCMDRCRTEKPEARGEGHIVKCHRAWKGEMT